jgi:hypothetical protein
MGLLSPIMRKVRTTLEEKPKAVPLISTSVPSSRVHTAHFSNSADNMLHSTLMHIQLYDNSSSDNFNNSNSDSSNRSRDYSSSDTYCSAPKTS